MSSEFIEATGISDRAESDKEKQDSTKIKRVDCDRVPLKKRERAPKRKTVHSNSLQMQRVEIDLIDKKQH